MFSHVADASKVALAFLVRYLQAQDVPWIDCQQETPHLSRLGARPIPRGQFLNELAAQLRLPAPAWGRGRLLPDGTLLPLD
jgi:leucyl/phenylalanyl-tRNA--protein transferase